MNFILWALEILVFVAGGYRFWMVFHRKAATLSPDQAVSLDKLQRFFDYRGIVPEAPAVLARMGVSAAIGMLLALLTGQHAVIGLAYGATGAMVGMVWTVIEAEKGRSQMNPQVAPAIETISAHLHQGKPMVEAIAAAATQTPPPLRKLLTRVARELQPGQVREQTLAWLAADTGSEVRLLGFAINKYLLLGGIGGDLAKIANDERGVPLSQHKLG